MSRLADVAAIASERTPIRHPTTAIRISRQRRDGRASRTGGSIARRLVGAGQDRHRRIASFMLTLRQLRYLDALSRHRHFGRAAEECAVSQPALSMQIQELEDCLGGALVERHHGNARLTERGVQIAERAALILSATRDLVEFAHRTGRLLVGTLRLGIIPTLAPYVLPRVIPELQRCYPELRLGLLEAQTKTLLNELTRGNIDVALLTLPVEKTDTETLRLFEDRFLLAVSAKDPLPERQRVTVSDVEQRRLLLLGEGHCLRDQALAYCGEAGNAADDGFFATSLATIMQMVASGYGITLLPEVAVNVELRDSRIKLLRFSDPQPSRSVGLMWRKTSPCREDFCAFGQVVLQATSPARALYEPGRTKPLNYVTPSADVEA